MSIGSILGAISAPFVGATAAAGSDLISGALDRRSQESINAENIAYQKEFAQNGIQWRVKDAQAAGVSPLFALGASGATFSPSSVALNYDDVSRAGGRFARAAEVMASQKNSDLIQAQIDEARSRTNYNNTMSSVEWMRGWSDFTRAVRPGLPGLPSSFDQPGDPNAKPAALDWPVGGHVKTDPNVTPNQVLQNEYGNLGADVLGLAQMVKDLWRRGIESYVRHQGDKGSKFGYGLGH